MDFKEIQELIRMVNKHSIAELTIENPDFKIKIKSSNGIVQNFPVAVQQFSPQPNLQQIQNPVAAEKGISKTEENSVKAESSEVSNLITIKSPIVGTFYRSTGPEKDPFVKVGDEISTGTIICIIEAMKLFNEIESEYSGKIVKILLDDASPVEYDQPLFLLEPK